MPNTSGTSSTYQAPSAQISPADDVKRLDNWFLTFWICMAAGIPLSLVIVGIGGVIAGVVFYCFIIHKLWSLIPVNVAKTTPGKAVGFFFIPFFHFFGGSRIASGNENEGKSLKMERDINATRDGVEHSTNVFRGRA